MKILHVSYSSFDGAGNAARRLHQSLKETSGHESELVYFKPYNKDSAHISWLEKKVNGLANIIINKFVKSESLNIIPTGLLKYINRSSVDLVHLHWIHGEMLSIEQIARIRKPLVWTFHDMWPVCGSEHYTNDERYLKGYHQSDAALKQEGRGWLQNWTWRRKLKAFSHLSCHILTPGNWMTSCAKKSYLFRNFQCETLFNGLDTTSFRPLACIEDLKRKYGLPENKKVILFGACKPTEMRKGWDLLVDALHRLGAKEHVCLAVFGQAGSEQVAGYETVWLGRIQEETAMVEIYNCADVMCVPSRQETFGQTASEPQSCGIPVVAFNATGLKDVVEHKKTGYLAEPFDAGDFSNGIQWVLHADGSGLSENARSRAIRLFDQDVIAKQALSIYERVLEEQYIDD